MIHPPEQQQQQLPIKDIASPISTDQLFELCDQELFPETLQNSEVSSCSNCCYEENSYTTNLSFSSFSSFPSDRGKSNNNNNNNSNTNSSSTLTPTNTNNNLSIIFDCSTQDENDNDISASIDFSPQSTFSNVPSLLTTQQDHQSIDLSSLQCQIPLTDVGNGFSSYCTDPVVSLKGPPSLPSVFEDDCLSPLPSYVRLDPSSPSCSFLDQTLGSFLPGSLSTRITGDASGVFAGNILLGSDLHPQELEFQGDNCGVYGSDPLQQVYNSGDIQALHNDSSQLVNGGGTSTLTSEISTLEESTYKVGKLSVEERKEKIHRYMKKRNERNFSKKIKYACRKTLADSRPRVRGRFAKNDDFGEAVRPSCSNHEDEDDEEVGMKEEEMVDHSDIFAHISGVNSFKCNFPIQSWI
ncbi:histone-lysine N-methyltransferase, H3 lysine-79 specific-like [Telopea speciosissima]|uniref:histone-lysine N-methyltransferase, H3 lysine-79 specific-like n=1 Tax=Telopea speciosissima TaxID=54955 RepID=UPI001CC37B1D|nr:histone-lysine N-methyltransferase, H3 lysine-79 specific-like [Telopea speciosissima]